MRADPAAGFRDARRNAPSRSASGRGSACQVVQRSIDAMSLTRSPPRAVRGVCIRAWPRRGVVLSD
jgi:hypothetical protein